MESPLTLTFEKYQTMVINTKAISDTGIVSPEDLDLINQEFNRLAIQTNFGMVLFGAAPIWLYSFLVARLCRLSLPWIAVYDPRIGGVIVHTMTQVMYVGKVLEI